MRAPTLILILLVAAAASLRAQPGVLEISHLTGGFYIYTTYKDLGGTPFPSNSMYVVTDSGVVMIDTPWDPAQTAPLLDSIRARHGRPVVLCIATHSHDDRTAGLDILRERGVATWSSAQTLAICREKGEREAEHSFTGDTTFTVGRLTLRALHPGAGHTVDNIVVWFPASRVLYGGCLVKSVESPGLGNVADADLKAWPKSIRRLMQLFPRRRYVIPGHFGWSDVRSLEHTLRLLRKRG